MFSHRATFFITAVCGVIVVTLARQTVCQPYDYTSDSLAVVRILAANGVDTIFVCADSDTPVTDRPCYVPVSVESLTTVRNGRIVALDLDDQLALGTRRRVLGLAPILPAEIGLITELESLSLEANWLQELPAELEQLNKLRFLHLLGNKFNHFPSVICRLPSLEYLDIGGNQLAEIPDSIGNLLNLKHLLLGPNPRLATLPSTIGRLVSLQSLDLVACQLTGGLPPELGNLRQLRILRLEYCGLTTLPVTIVNLDSLLLLDVAYNRLCSLDSTVAEYLDHRCPGWRGSQVCNQAAVTPAQVRQAALNTAGCDVRVYDLLGRPMDILRNPHVVSGNRPILCILGSGRDRATGRDVFSVCVVRQRVTPHH